MAAQHANQRTPDGTPPEDVEEHEQLNDDAPVRANFGAGTRRPRTGAFSVSTRSSRGAMYDLRVGPLVITLADQSAQEMTQGKAKLRYGEKIHHDILFEHRAPRRRATTLRTYSACKLLCLAWILTTNQTIIKQ